MEPSTRLRQLFPITEWLLNYQQADLADDITAGLVTAILLVPQGMAYALLAGLPPEVGLYASIAPPIAYALLGTSRPLSVGPVSVAALLVASALSVNDAGAGRPDPLSQALLLAAMTGIILLIMSVLKLGILVNFLGHPVLSGFSSGAAVLIIISQMNNLTGVPLPPAGSSVEMLGHALQNLEELKLPITLLGISSIILLLLLKAPLVRLLQMLGLSKSSAGLVSRAGPLTLVLGMTLLVAGLNLDEKEIAIVGEISSGLPAPTLDFINMANALDLLPSALMIALIDYVESVSVGKVLAYRRRQKIRNNQELIALGASNLAAAFTGGMPVAGGFSRSMVNYAAGARGECD